YLPMRNRSEIFLGTSLLPNSPKAFLYYLLRSPALEGLVESWNDPAAFLQHVGNSLTLLGRGHIWASLPFVMLGLVPRSRLGLLESHRWWKVGVALAAAYLLHQNGMTPAAIILTAATLPGLLIAPKRY